MTIRQQDTPEELRKQLAAQEHELHRLRTRLTQVGLDVENDDADGSPDNRRRSEVEKRVQWEGGSGPIRDVSEEDDINETHLLHKRSRTSTEMFLNHMTDVEEREAALIQRVQELEAQLEESHFMGKAETSKSDSGSRRPSATSTQGHKEIQELQEELDACQDSLERQEKREAELRQKYHELETKYADQQATICELEQEVANGKTFLDQANNRYSDLWRKAEDHRKQLNEVKERLEQREKQLAAEREQRADLDMKMRSRKSSHVRASLAVEFGAAQDDAELAGDLDALAGEQPLEEEVQLLREEVDRVQTHLFEVLEERDALQKVEKDLRQDLQTAHRKYDEQLKVTEGFADAERTLRRQLTDVTSRASLRNSRVGMEALLQGSGSSSMPLEAAAATAGGGGAGKGGSSSSVAGHGGALLAQVSEEEVLEEASSESADEGAEPGEEVSSLREKLEEAESHVQELQKQLDKHRSNEQEWKTKIATLKQQMIMVQGLHASDGSTGASGCEGGNVGGAAASEAASVNPEEEIAAKGQGFCQPDDELHYKTELLELRSQLREVACVLLHELDALPTPPDESWVDSWMVSAKRIVCGRERVVDSSDPDAIAARRRDILWSLINHLDQHSEETLASSFDATSF